MSGFRMNSSLIIHSPSMSLLALMKNGSEDKSNDPSSPEIQEIQMLQKAKGTHARGGDGIFNIIYLLIKMFFVEN